MARKPIPNAIPASKDAFIHLDSSSDGMMNFPANSQIGTALASIQPVQRASASSFGCSNEAFSLRHTQDVMPRDFSIWRPGDTNTFKAKEMLSFSNAAYKRVGIVRNIVDLMGDFTAEGIKIVHPNPQVERFFQAWWEKIEGLDRSERFSNKFYRLANVIVKRDMHKLPAKTIDQMERGIAATQLNQPYETDFLDYSQIYDRIEEPLPKVTKNVIPLNYDFLDPFMVDMVGGSLSSFAGKPVWALRVPPDIVSAVQDPQTPEHVDIVNGLPPYIRDPIKAGKTYLKLDPDRVSSFHYKKDDWEVWASPMTYAIMDDIIMLQKLKMADIAALDGIISSVRVWKLGNIDAKLFPTEAAIAKLNALLSHAGNGQQLDLIWGPDISLEQTKTDSHNFLGPKKYEATLAAIYAGMGVPSTLTGSSGAAGGLSSNFLGLKTLTERLNYGRAALTRFWTNEIRLVQQAMNFRFPAKVEYKYMVLTNEEAMHSLLINLLDRDVIGLDRIREHFGYIPEVEEASIKRDYKARAAKRIPAKASPFHDAHPDLTLEKIFATTGVVSPSQVGLELDPKGKDEITSLDLQKKASELADSQHALQKDQLNHTKKITTLQTKQQHELNMQTQKDATKVAMKHGPGPLPADNPPGQPGQGRPPGKTDDGPRKQRQGKPRSSASYEEEDSEAGSGFSSEFLSLQMWAKAAQETLSEMLNPVYLKTLDKSHMRKLTDDEVESLEGFKWATLCNLRPYQDLSRESVGVLLNAPLVLDQEANLYWKILVSGLAQKKAAQPTIDEIKQIQSYIYATANLHKTLD